MFLSQACKKSPPAADYLADLRARPDLVVLDWHIDYWNLLSNGKYGRWEDPYSDASFSERQRIYNRRIRRKDMVFTPQAIIDGAKSVVGSRKDDVENAIVDERAASAADEIEIRTNGGKLAITVKGAENAEVYLVSFHDWETTDITGGDNAGVTFREPNIVTGVTPLGSLSAAQARFEAEAPGAGFGCAVIAQEPGQGKVLAARYCP